MGRSRTVRIVKQVGPDVYPDSIQLTVARPEGEVRTCRRIPGSFGSVDQLLTLPHQPPFQLRFVYEAGHTDHSLVRPLRDKDGESSPRPQPTRRLGLLEARRRAA